MGFLRLLLMSGIILIATWAILLYNTDTHEYMHYQTNYYMGGDNTNAKIVVNWDTTGYVNGTQTNPEAWKETRMLDAINDMMAYNTRSTIITIMISLFILILYLEMRTED